MLRVELRMRAWHSASAWLKSPLLGRRNCLRNASLDHYQIAPFQPAKSLCSCELRLPDDTSRGLAPAVLLILSGHEIHRFVVSVGVNMKKLVTRTIVLALGLLISASSARSNTITPYFGTFTSGVSIVYGATLTSGEIHSGDGFTIYDTGGFVSASAPTDWLVTTSGTGSPFGSASLSTADLGGYTNVHFTYVGADVIETAGLVLLGTFSISTTATTLVQDDWLSIDHLYEPGPTSGAAGPVHTQTISVAVPDGGSTVALLGGALLALGSLRRKFNKR
jgi:hypothetical protein